MHYHWYKNGMEMPNGRGMRILFQPVHAADAGQYLCKVTNAAGDDVSNSANLQVGELWHSMSQCMYPVLELCLAVPHQTSSAIQDLLVSERHRGREVTMRCASNVPSVIWFKNDELIEGAPGGRQFQLKRVEAGHFGRYSCKSISGSSLSQRGIEVSVGQ